MGRLPRNVALLAAASFLADVSGEMLLAVLPFLLVAQGATGVGLGLVGGAAEAVGHLLKPAFGALADRMRRRKPLIVGGYLTAALARVGIALAAWWPISLAFRAADRVGKGMRTAPRDALLAESVTPAERGRAFGLHRAADTAGAVVGVGAALVLLLAAGFDPSTVVLAGALVGLLTVVPLAFVREADADPAAPRRAFEAPSPRYRAFLGVAALFALGNVSYLFFVLRARDAVGGAAGAVGLYLLFNVVYAALAYPAGTLADRWGKPRLLAAGYALFALAAGLLLAPPEPMRAVASFLVLGVAFACIEGVQRAFAADLAGTAARSTRLGLFHASVGLATVAGGLAAGALWDAVGPWAAFAWGAGVPLLALGLLVTAGFLRR